ncbi:MAG: SOS response-associated peptidase [Planctomycetaceae bacterium]|nr:SOS response-associated peptidase [Planctomycetota bacterium]NUN53549.1 SOS response-associated peptidase [Planctomycetaceae bacterium]
MCGRYTLGMTPAEVLAALRAEGPPPDQPPRWNVAPTQAVIVAVITNEGGRRLRHMRWGLIPRWAKDPAIGNRLINARAETLAEKPSFRDAYRKRRCLIVADGFYEWRKVGGRKEPVWIHPVDGGVLTFAGLWETWKGPDGATVESCTIVTTEANALIGTFHHRMPVILPEEARDRWLDPAPREPSELADLLVPFPPERLALRTVTTRVNSPAREGPDLLDPAPPAEGGGDSITE